MSENENKKHYEAPAIIFEEEVEAIASACSSGFVASSTCRFTGPACDSLLN